MRNARASSPKSLALRLFPFAFFASWRETITPILSRDDSPPLRRYAFPKSLAVPLCVLSVFSPLRELKFDLADTFQLSTRTQAFSPASSLHQHLSCAFHPNFLSDLGKLPPSPPI